MVNNVREKIMIEKTLAKKRAAIRDKDILFLLDNPDVSEDEANKIFYNGMYGRSPGKDGFLYPPVSVCVKCTLNKLKRLSTYRGKVYFLCAE